MKKVDNATKAFNVWKGNNPDKQSKQIYDAFLGGYKARAKELEKKFTYQTKEGEIK